MKHTVFFIISFFVIPHLVSQNKESEKYLLTKATNSYEMNYLNILDPYLSPLNYSGMGVNYQHRTQKLLKTDNTKLSSESTIRTTVGALINPAKNASMSYLGYNSSWGLNYHFELIEKIKFLAGANINLNIGYKNIARNINNPINIDLASNINISARALYDFNIRCQKFKLSSELELPIIGYMFVPAQGGSYYEMFDLENLSNTFHFSSLHNKRGLRANLLLDVPLKRSTLIFGAESNQLKYKANNMIFKLNEIGVIFGIRYDFHIFSGTKEKIPPAFIGIDN